MIKSVTIFLFILLLGSAVVMSQSNITVQDKKDSATITTIQTQQQQAIQQNSNATLVADSNAVNGNNYTKNQVPLEKQFLDAKKEKQMKKQLQQKNDSLKIQ